MNPSALLRRQQRFAIRCSWLCYQKFNGSRPHPTRAAVFSEGRDMNDVLPSPRYCVLLQGSDGDCAKREPHPRGATGTGSDNVKIELAVFGLRIDTLLADPRFPAAWATQPRPASKRRMREHRARTKAHARTDEGGGALSDFRRGPPDKAPGRRSRVQQGLRACGYRCHSQAFNVSLTAPA
jgi:hypothetical protein